MKRIPSAAATLRLHGRGTFESANSARRRGHAGRSTPAVFAQASRERVCYNFTTSGEACAVAVRNTYMPEINKPKWVIASLAAALGVVLLIVLAERGPAPQVQIVSVTREDLTASITGNGKVEPISPTVARAQFPTFRRGRES